MKKYLLIISTALLLLPLTVFAAHRHHHPIPPPAPAPAPSPVPQGITFGAFNANVGTVSVTFIGWKDAPPSCGKTNFIYWENTGISLDSIVNGSQDSVIKSFAAKVCLNDVVSVFHEMNGDWDTWDGTVGNNSPAKVIAAYQHIHNLVGSKVKWAWVTNNVSEPDVKGNQLENYYPGASYVDIVGIDAFTYSGETFSQAVPASLLARLKTYGKPMWITSLGTNINQNAWITDMLRKLPATGVSGLLYFDYDVWTLPASTLSKL